MKKAGVFVIAILFIASFAYADYIKEMKMNLSANGIRDFAVDCGAGSLEISGVDGLDEIRVMAEIVIEDMDDDEAEEFMDKYMVLDLDKRGSGAELRSFFETSSRSWFFFGGGNYWINLTIKVPMGLKLDIDDGSGNMYVENMANDVKIDDGSGSMTILDITGNVYIEDGSGEIEAENIRGELEIDDGSGEIDLEQIYGELTIDDGSGEINAKGVEGDVDIDDGSGDMVLRNITGSVVVDDGSDDIRINGVTEDVRIISSGSGGTRITNVDGRVYGDVDI